MKRFGAELAVALLAVLLALVVGALLIAARGHDPMMVYGVLLRDTLGEPSGLSQVALKTTTLLFTGVASAFAFRAGMFNIGGEGQLYLGAFASAVIALVLPKDLPGVVAVPVLVAAAFAGGALAAVVPAALKATRGTHEVINTMMMNFIVISGVNWLLHFVRESAEVVRTPPIPAAWRLPVFVRGFDGNASLFLGLLACGAVAWVLARTRSGYELRAVGQNPLAAEAGGVSVPRMILASLLVSGGLAGMGGVNYVLGSPGHFEQHFAPFQGYLGIAVALLARNNPVAVIPAAALFAILAEGGQAIQEFIPKEIGNILQAVVVVFVVLGARLRQIAGDLLEKRRLARPT